MKTLEHLSLLLVPQAQQVHSWAFSEMYYKSECVSATTSVADYIQDTP